MRIVGIHYMHAMHIATQSAISVSVEVSQCAPDIGLLSSISLKQTNSNKKKKTQTEKNTNKEKSSGLLLLRFI